MDEARAVANGPWRAARLDARVRSLTGLSPTGLLSLVAVLAVLVVVSIPRLRALARTENEADARAIVELLARELADHDGELPPRIDELIAPGTIERALSDAELLGDGALLRRHGYLFRVVALDADGPPPQRPGTVLAAEATPSPRFAIQAWPWELGRSGSAALLGTPRGAVYRCGSPDRAWDGRGGPAAVQSWAGWRPLP